MNSHFNYCPHQVIGHCVKHCSLIGCLLGSQFSQDGGHQNGHRLSSKSSHLYTAYSICVISKYPYYNALRDCLSW